MCGASFHHGHSKALPTSLNRDNLSLELTKIVLDITYRNAKNAADYAKCQDFLCNFLRKLVGILSSLP